MKNDAPLNAKRRSELSPIFFALQSLNTAPNPEETIKCIEKLIELGADINVTVPNGEFAGENVMIAAARRNFQDIVDQLINNNGNVSFVSKSGKTAFYYAARNQNAEMLSHLIEASSSLEADLNRKYEDNKSLMHILFTNSVTDRNADSVLECIKILFNNDMDYDSPDNNLNTPLHLAAQYEHAGEIVEFLMLNGCDPQETNKKERTVFLIAHKRILPIISRLSLQDDVRKAIKDRKEQIKILEAKKKEEKQKSLTSSSRISG